MARAAARAGELDPGKVLSAEPVWRWLGGVALAGLLLSLWMWTDPGGTRNAWATLFLGGEPAAVRVGNLRLTVVPPAYTELPSTTLEGTDGSVEGFPGTRVTLAGRLSRAVSSGQWEGPGGEVVGMELDREGFSVSWMLQRAGTYRLEFFEGRFHPPRRSSLSGCLRRTPSRTHLSPSNAAPFPGLRTRSQSTGPTK